MSRRATAGPADFRLRNRQIVAVFLVLLAALVGVAVPYGTGGIESTVKGRALDAVVLAWTGADPPIVTVVVRGRTVTVNGRVPDAKAHLAVIQAIRRTRGVRRVVDLLEVGVPVLAPSTSLPATAETVSLSPGVIRARFQSGRVTLEGTIIDGDARNELVEALRSALGERLIIAVTSRFSPGQEPNVELITALLEPFAELVIGSAPLLPDGSIALSESTLLLLGTVVTDADRLAVGARAASLSDRWNVVNALQRSAPSSSVETIVASTTIVAGERTASEAEAILADVQSRLDELFATTSVERTPNGTDFNAVTGLIFDEAVRIIEEAGEVVGVVEVRVRAASATRATRTGTVPSDDPERGATVAAVQRRADQVLTALRGRGLSVPKQSAIAVDGSSANDSDSAGSDSGDTNDRSLLDVRVVVKAPPLPSEETRVPARTDTTLG